MSEKICGEFCAGICQISYTGRFCVRTIGASCGIFFCLSVLSHNHSCGAGAPVIVRLSCAWPPPPHLGGHIRNAPCINYQVCARGVFRSQSARPFISMLLSGMTCPGFQHIWAKTRENGAIYGSRPVGNAGESICFRDSDRQTSDIRMCPQIVFVNCCMWINHYMYRDILPRLKPWEDVNLNRGNICNLSS